MSGGFSAESRLIHAGPLRVPAQRASMTPMRTLARGRNRVVLPAEAMEMLEAP